jgi:Carbohydrate binding domain
VPAGNLYDNGDFTNGTNSWQLNAATAEVLDDASHCGSYVRLTPTAGTGVGQIFQIVSPFESGLTVRVRYDIRASAPRNCTVRIIDHGSSFTSFGYSATCPTPQEWTRVDETFVGQVPGDYSDSGMRFHFILNRADTTPIDIDNISVVLE